MHRRHIVLAGIVSFLLAVLLWQLTPEQRVARYISAHREDLEARADAYFAGEASFSYPGDLFAANTWHRRALHGGIHSLLPRCHLVWLLLFP